jgi:hypothetical protein
MTERNILETERPERHVCAVCRRVLGWFTLTGGQVVFTHADPATDHDPRPVPLRGGESIPVCDFCGQPHPTWDFPAAAFQELSHPLAYWGGWAACDVCHRMITKNRWHRLNQRIWDRYEKTYGTRVPPAKRAEHMNTLRSFDLARTGPPVRLE